MYFHEYCNEVKTVFGYGVKERVEVRQSAFQTIEIYETLTHGHLMTIDGFVMLTTRDNYFYHEVMGHAGIAACDTVKDFLIIGGCDCRTVREVLSQ